MLATGAQAKTITIGSSLGGVDVSQGCGPTGCTIVSLSVLGSNPTTSPVDGVVVAWRILGADTTPGIALRVLRPSGDTYVGAGTSGRQAVSGPGVQVFPTNLPIKVGDRIGLDIPPEGKAGFRIGGTYAGWAPAIGDNGLPQPMVGPFPGELLVNADIVTVPAVSLLLPSSGPIAGETPVEIAGSGFEGATAVKFGDQPAPFSVASDTRITAKAPKGLLPGEVDVTVTTPAGTTAVVTGDRYTYTACVVPKLKGKKLKAVRKALTKANCKLGKVRGKKGKKAKVKKQGAKAGTVLAPGAKVTVKVG
jgi:hypothetical protein